MDQDMEERRVELSRMLYGLWPILGWTVISFTEIIGARRSDLGVSINMVLDELN